MTITKSLLLLALTGSAMSVRDDSAQNPLSKVIDLMTALEAKIAKEGEVEAKAFKEYFEWCDDVSKNTANEIATGKKKKEELEATIEKCEADISAATSKIEDLAASIASDESDLKDATVVREKEKAEFVAAEGELMETVDALDRAIGILEREMAKNPALMQVDTSSFKGLIQSLSTVIDAAAILGKDKKRILALVQSQHQAKDTEEQKADAEEMLLSMAPAPDAYKSHSGGIVDILEDLKDKAETELSDTRKAETNAAHNYKMLKTSLDDSIAAETKDLAEEKAAKAAAEELKATSEGDLAMTAKDLAEAEEALATAQSTCMTVAADHEATVTGRKEELAVIAKAKEILSSTTTGAVGQTYSLLQETATSRLRTRADLAHMEVVGLIKSLARKNHSRSLEKLASQIQVLMQYGAKFGDDPFAKVKGLITDLITRLEKEAAAEAAEKAYCDEQMAKTEAKKSELEDDIAKLTAKIDKAAATSAKLKDEVKELQAELAAIAKEQAEADKYRSEEHDEYVAAKADLEQGLYGVGKALDMLRDYYGAAAALLQAGQPPMPEKHTKSSGAAGGIIDILEVVQSDMSSELAKEETQEADAAETYEKVTQENKVTTSVKNQDVKYKTAEYKGLDKMIGELTGDKANLSTELDAVLEYYAKIKDRCIAKPETYEERKARREAEIAGLKQALAILSGEALLQKGDRAGALRR
jgi:hypothetical protein